MVVRVATEEDLKIIDDIYNQAVEHGGLTADLTPLTSEKRIEWFHDHSSIKYPIFVALEKNQVAGFVSISPYRKGREALSETAEISYYVDKSCHRRGIATTLIKHAESICIENGIKTLFAIILESNQPSIGLMLQHGYTLWGRLPNVARFGSVQVSHVYYGKRLVE